MDSLITALVVVIISIIVTVLKKRGLIKDGEEETPSPQNRDARTGQPRSSSPQAPPPKATSWEEELRRLLEGNAPVAPPPARPPPVVFQSPKAAGAPPTAPPVIRPVVLSRPRPVPVQLPAQAPAPVAARMELHPRELATMAESRQAYQRASDLDRVVAEHIDRVPGQHVQATSVMRRAVPPEVAQAVALFKSANTARQAVLASIILGPPRALEQSPANF